MCSFSQVPAAAADNVNLDSFILVYCTIQQSFKKQHYIKLFSGGEKKINYLLLIGVC